MNELIDLGILTTSLWIFLRLLPLLFFFSFHFIFIPLDFFVLFCKTYFWWWWWSIVYFCFLSIHSFVDHNHHWCDNLMIQTVSFVKWISLFLFWKTISTLIVFLDVKCFPCIYLWYPKNIQKRKKTTISIDSNVLSIDYLHFFVVEILDETKKMTNEMKIKQKILLFSKSGFNCFQNE